VALHRLALLGGFIFLGSCGSPKPVGQSTPTPVVEVLPDTTATADVDRRATMALKQNLLNSFPQNSPSTAVETGLSKDGFDCGPNPAAPTERACLKAVREGACEINTIVRTTPYAPEKAQVIRVCEVGAPAAKSD
jgi:hypothetical protein